MPTPKLAAAALCALALAASGCGGGGYKDDLGSAERQFNKGTRQALPKMQAASTATRRAGIRQYRTVIEAFEGKLRTLKPPGDVKPLQARLVTALDAVSEDLGSLLQLLDSGDVTKAQPFALKYLRDLRSVQTTAKELHKKVD